MSSLVHTSFAFILKYRDRNVISHFFCGLLPLLKLSCTDTSLNEWLLSTYGSSVKIICFKIIIISYFYILLSVLKIHSSSGRKTFSTRASHLTCGHLPGNSALHLLTTQLPVFSQHQRNHLSVLRHHHPSAESLDLQFEKQRRKRRC